MGQLVEVQVPDIGDFKDVEVIEVLVKPGDTVAKEQSLITVESDKASMEIPSSAAGVVEGTEGQARRQGLAGLAGAAARCCGQRSRRCPLRRRKATSAKAAATQALRAAAATPAARRRSRDGSIEVVVPDIGDFKDVEVIEVLVEAGRHGGEGAVADHGGKRQGVDGDSVVGGRSGEGTEGQARRQGLAGQSGRRAEWRAGRCGGRPRHRQRHRLQLRPPRPNRQDRPRSRPKWARGRSQSIWVRPPGVKPHASPSVRKFARELGVDLTLVRGSRRQGSHHVRRRARARQGRDGGRRAAAAAAPPRASASDSTCRRGRSWTSPSSVRSSASRCRASARSRDRPCRATG